MMQRHQGPKLIQSHVVYLFYFPILISEKQNVMIPPSNVQDVLACGIRSVVHSIMDVHWVVRWFGQKGQTD